MHQCLHNKAPQYLVDCCVPVLDVASRQQLLSACRCLLTIPHHRRSTLGHRAFSVLLPHQLRDSDSLSLHSDKLLKHSSSTSISVQRIRGVYDYVLYKSTFYLLAYLLMDSSLNFPECLYFFSFFANVINMGNNALCLFSFH